MTLALAEFALTLELELNCIWIQTTGGLRRVKELKLVGIRYMYVDGCWSGGGWVSI